MKGTISNVLKIKEIGVEVQVHGRIIAKRHDGMFIDIQDFYSKIQCYITKDIYRKIEMGQIVTVRGITMRTESGEFTIEVSSLIINSRPTLRLQKAYYSSKGSSKHRINDLIYDPEVKNGIIAKSKVVRLLRKMMEERDFTEVETPILHKVPNGANATPFKTERGKRDLYLRIAPELFLKRLVVAGMWKVFEIAKCFRNEGISNRHQPEFNMLEAYAAFQDISYMINVVEDVVSAILGTSIEWVSYDYISVVSKVAGKNIEFETKLCANDRLVIERKIREYNSRFCFSNADDTNLMDECISYFLAGLSEQYVHIKNHPKSMCVLAKFKGNKSLRFESFIRGIEVANGYEEQENYEILSSDDSLDKDFIHDIGIGMPNTVGLGIGVERLTMLTHDIERVRNIVAFPHTL